MRKFLIIFVLQIFANIQCDEFITVWAPKHAPDNQRYNIFYHPTNINKKTEVAVQYRNTTVTKMLKSQGYQRIEYANAYPKPVSDFYVTLLRNETSNRKICFTQELKIESQRRKFIIFIQLDKPIYKPGDEIKSRIIVVDRQLVPYQTNNINITIHDPLNRIIFNNDDLGGQNFGVVEVKYKVSDYAIIGDWKIRVEVEKYPQWAVSKVVPIQKYVLPLFEVIVDLSDTHVLREQDLSISLQGRYPFGENVIGKAELTIRNAVDGYVYKTQKFENVVGIHKVNYHVTKDLKIRVPNNMDQIKLEAYVEFEEPESGLRFNKSAPFYVHNDMKYRLVVTHPEKYLPNMPFVVKVSVFDWKNNQLNQHYEKVILEYSRKLTNGHTGSVTTPKFLEEGIAMFEIIPKEDFEVFEIIASFVNSRAYRKEIPRGKVGVAIHGLKVEATPQNPKINDRVTVYVRGDSSMDSILMVVMSRSGNLMSDYILCNDRTVCEFKLTITEDMMPHSTVIVYHVVDRQHIYQGQTNITTDAFGSNDLTLTLSKNNARTKEAIRMTFETAPKSKVYVLAFDKRLKYLRDGNDVTKQEVVGTYADFDGSNYMLVFDLSQESAWHTCTPEELTRVEKNRQFLGQQSGDVLRPADIYDDDGEPFAEPSVVEDESEEAIDADILRSNFPETWIFETVKLGKKETSVTKNYIVPDSMTTWLISAFSVKEDQRLAMAPTQELIVKNEFFIKVSMPYSIRFMEVLRLDILVYNYVNSGETLDVTIQLDNLQKRTAKSNKSVREFEFVEYSNDVDVCRPSYNTAPKSSQKIKVPNMSVKRVSFYIRANPKDNEFDEKILRKILFQIRAKGKGFGGDYEDAVHMRLLVEPVGIKAYSVKSKDYKLDGNSKTDFQFYGDENEKSIDDVRSYPRTNVVVTGDYLTNMMRLDSKFDFYPWNCLEQRTSKLKGNIEYFRYQMAKNGNASRAQFYDYYQKMLNEGMNSVWSYKHATGYRAYFVEAFTTAIQLTAIAEDSRNTAIIESELNYLKSIQTAAGNFPATDFPVPSPGIYYDTAYTLISFMKYQKLKKNTNLYQDVVTKGFNFLTDTRNEFNLKNEAYSIGAYAYAMEGDYNKSMELMTKVEKSKILYENRQKCYKANKGDTTCDLRHTVHGALAYIEMKMMNEAALLVNWILSTYNINYLYSNTYDMAIATEPIAKMANYLKVPQTNLKFDIRNEFGAGSYFEITKYNSAEPRDIEFPQYTRNVTFSASGHGYFTVNTIFEYKVYSDVVSQLFNVTINTNLPQNTGNDEKVIEICARYIGASSSLTNVIYEVAIPSGYVYVDVVDLVAISNELKLIEHKRKRTLVLMYFDEFTNQKSYCVKIRTKKLYEVRNLQNAGVKVYDYSEKSSIAVQFYDFSPSRCT